MTASETLPTACPTARALAADLVAGRTNSVAAIRACLDRIAARDPALGAFIVVGAEQALEAAQAWDKARELGDKVPPLAGVPLAVKDNIDTADLPTSYGSDIYDRHRPVADAACVALARNAGAVVVGKTVTTEFAYYRPGRDREPARSRAHARRLVAGVGSGCRGGSRATCRRHADGGLDHPPRRLLRRGRLQADLGLDPARRRQSHLRLARHRRAHRA